MRLLLFHPWTASAAVLDARLGSVLLLLCPSLADCSRLPGPVHPFVEGDFSLGRRHCLAHGLVDRHPILHFPLPVAQLPNFESLSIYLTSRRVRSGKKKKKYSYKQHRLRNLSMWGMAMM